MTANLNIGTVRETLEGLATAEQVGTNRIVIHTIPDRVHRILLIAQKILQCDHLIQISAVDNGATFELVYNMTGPHRMVLTVSTEIPRDRPEAPDTSDILPAAELYERQIRDLMGIDFKGYIDRKRIILNEDWPAGEYPLRKDWKPGPGTFYGGYCREET
jgi:membrane-bound hydrogenase subunit beta